MNYQQIIKAFRQTKDPSLLQDFTCQNNEEGFADRNYQRRTHLVLTLYEVYSQADRYLIKWLLREEQKGLELGLPAYTLDICAFMLYNYMMEEDIYILYDAKFCGYSDAQFLLDIELVFGMSRERTKSYLKEQKTKKEYNDQILKTIERYEANLNAKFRNRAAYIQYFEENKIYKLREDLAQFDNTLFP